MLRIPRTNISLVPAPVKRQNTASEVDVEAAAMSDASGNVIAFDSNKVATKGA